MNANAQPQPEAGRGASRMGLVAMIVAAIVLYGLVAYSMRDSASALKGPAIGKHLPYLELEPLTGDAMPVKLEDLKGKVSLVNYWGTWCPPCRREFPHIVDLAERYKDRPEFRLYAVSCGQGGEDDLESLRRATEEFLEVAKVDLPTYTDQNYASRKALSLVLEDHQFGYPTTVLLDRTGAIRGLWQGYHPGAELEMLRGIDELLGSPGEAKSEPAS